MNQELIPVKVAMIGSGNIGQALGGALVKAGHEVTIAARDEVETRLVANAIGATAASLTDAVADAEVVVLAVPYTSLASVAEQIKDDVAGKVVIEVSNRMEPASASAAEELAAQLPSAHVAKAFNTNFATVLAQPDLQGQTLDSFYAADDHAARDRVAALIESIGLRPVLVGGLTSARQLEAIGLLSIQLQIAAQGNWQSNFVLVGAPEAALAGLPKAA